jgi:inner membrane protein
MDNVTHTLTGLMLARCGLDRGVKGTPIMLMIAANVPDIDGVSLFWDPLTYLNVHRSYTHTFLFIPVMAFVSWGLVSLIRRQSLGWGAYIGAMVVVLSHLLLDATNVYGIRLLLPFSEHWYRLDITDIVDPWILAILILALAAPALVKLVGDEISGRKSLAPKRGWAVFAMVMMMLYEGGRYVSHERALAILNSHLYAGAPPSRVTATPDRINPLRWQGIVEGEGYVYEVPVPVTGNFNVTGGRIDYPAGESPAIDAARKTEPFKVFERFDQLPFWRLLPEADGLRVELLDLRFGSILAPGFLAFADVEQNGHVRESQVRFGLPRR